MTSFLKLRLIISLLTILFGRPVFGQDKLIDILNEEVQREMQVLKQQETPAYYISYRVDEMAGYSINTSFGALTYSDDNKAKYLTVTVREI